MPKSDSYKQATCCQDKDCFLLDTNDNEPCWGQVEVVGEDCLPGYSDCWWIHGCQGHDDFLGKYIIENHGI